MTLIEGLAGWLKQIIAVVLLASLVDLLLPNRTMQRYVRLVAGLFILLVVATPLLKWIQGDFGGKLAAQLAAVSRTPDTARAELSRIEEEGRKMRERKTEQAADLVAARLAEAIRADIEQNEKRRVLSVDLHMQTQREGTLSVRDVAVTLEAVDGDQKPNGDSSETVKPIADVERIAPVTVDISAGKWPDGASGESRANPEGANAGKPDGATSLRISAFIAARYGIPADRITVTEKTPERG